MSTPKTKLATVAELCTAYDQTQQTIYRLTHGEPITTSGWRVIQAHTKTRQRIRDEIDVLVDAAMGQIATSSDSIAILNSSVELSYFNTWHARRGGW